MKPRAYIITLLIILTFVVSKVSVTSFLYFRVKRAHRCEEFVAMGRNKAQELYEKNHEKYAWSDRDRDGIVCESFK